MTYQPRTSAGFSLLEVVVAFAIAAVALAIIGQIFGQGSRNLALTRDYGTASAIAERLFAEHGQSPGLDPTEYSDSEGEFAWHVATRPYYIPERVESALDTASVSDLQLVEIAVTVDWQRNAKTRSLSLNSLRLVAKSDAAAPL